MIDNVNPLAAAVAGAVDQAGLDARVNAGVNMTGPLLDIDPANSVDARQYCMCWLLTRVLRPSLREQMPPTAASNVARATQTVQPQVPPGNRKSLPVWLFLAARSGSVVSAQPADQVQPIGRDPEDFSGWVDTLFALIDAGRRGSQYDYSLRDNDNPLLSTDATESSRSGPPRQGFDHVLGHVCLGNDRAILVNSDADASLGLQRRSIRLPVTDLYALMTLSAAAQPSWSSLGYATAGSGGRAGALVGRTREIDERGRPDTSTHRRFARLCDAVATSAKSPPAVEGYGGGTAIQTARFPRQPHVACLA
jgi:hypothetical protein